jgi:hypothetical protein
MPILALGTTRDGTWASHKMASFQKLRRTAQPSASAGGFRTFWNTLAIAEAGLAAAHTASAHSELASFKGNHAAQQTPKRPARGTSLVGAAATFDGAVA